MKKQPTRSLEFTLPLRLVAADNSREHWRVVAMRKREQRELAAMWTRSCFREVILSGSQFKTPYPITITRIGKRKMDSDNLSGSAKYVRDGIADALGINDGDETKVEWKYQQEIGKEYAVKIRIETKEKAT